jgi:hypothetical protein
MTFSFSDLRDYRNWYWVVGSSNSEVYSSATNTYVSIADATYVAWLANGNSPSRIFNEVELWGALAVNAPGLLADWLFDGATFVQPSPGLYTKKQLAAYAASVRYNKEVGGTVISGVPYLTDRETQAKLTSAALMMQVNPAATIQWKGADGSFVTLDAAGMLSLASAVGAFVQTCFGTEATVLAAIEADTITSLADIDAAFAA